MAEIRIKRDRRGVSLWVGIALLALALYIGWLLLSNPAGRNGVVDSVGTSTAVASEEDAGSIDGSAAPEIATFLTWNEDHAAMDTMSVDHRHTATGIRHLAAALGALANDVDEATVKRELVALGNYADTLEQNTASMAHARHARAAFVSLGGLLMSVQQRRFPELAGETTAVLDAADAMDANRPLLDQGTRVNEFFDRAAVMVRRMSQL